MSLDGKVIRDFKKGKADLLDASLIASGVDYGGINQYKQKFLKICEALDCYLEEGNVDTKNAYELAKNIFDFTWHKKRKHNKIFRMDKIIDDYFSKNILSLNCIGGTVYYNNLCNHYGLKSCVVISPGHILSKVVVDDNEINVENTNRCGFDFVTGEIGVPFNNTALMAAIYHARARELDLSLHKPVMIKKNMKNKNVADINFGQIKSRMASYNILEKLCVNIKLADLEFARYKKIDSHLISIKKTKEKLRGNLIKILHPINLFYEELLKTARNLSALADR